MFTSVCCDEVIPDKVTDLVLTVDVTQDGTGSHNATIHLSGNSSSVTLTQDSSTNQNYHLQQSCSSSSCSATVTQN